MLPNNIYIEYYTITFYDGNIIVATDDIRFVDYGILIRNLRGPVTTTAVDNDHE